MYCTKCGNPRRANDGFCGKCGSALEGVDRVPVASDIPDEPRAQVETTGGRDESASEFDAGSPPWSQTKTYDAFALSPEQSHPAVSHTSLPRPWIRYWAKIVDVYVAAIVFGFLLGLIFPELLRQNDLVLGVLFLFCWTVSEPLVLSSFGSTPGRALLNFKVVGKDDRKIPLGKLYERSFRVWFAGMGLGIPIVTLITHIMSYNDLEKHKQSAWDRDLGTQVLHGRVSPWRVIVLVVLLLAFFTFVVLGTMAQNGAY
jgi:hypothetical protein